ncbi:hypothetical protein LEI94_27215 [Salmonella enterica]|nr:hypothetical protein [Salmonella enterica]
MAEWTDRDVRNGDCDGSGNYGGYWQSEYSITGFMAANEIKIIIEGTAGGPGRKSGTGTIVFDPTTAGEVAAEFGGGGGGRLHVAWAGGEDQWSSMGIGQGEATTYVINGANHAGKG